MKKAKFIIIILLLVIISSFFLTNKLGKKINPVIYRYSTIEAKRFSTILINSAIEKETLNKIKTNLFEVEKNDTNQIEMLDYNTKNVNEVLEKITKNIQKKLLDLEEGKLNNLMVADEFKGKNFKLLKNGIICEIPTSVIFSNSLLSNVGPIIPIKISFIGSVTTNLNTKIKEYGINNLYVEINIHVEINQRITMPLMTKNAKTSVDLPLTIKLIEGKIPSYYYQNGLNENSKSYMLPIK